MKLSLRSEYALLSLIHLARLPDPPSAVGSIEISQQIPHEALCEILLVLVKAGFLQLSNENCRLAKPAESISVAEIIRLFDGAFAPLEPISEKGYQPAPMEKEVKLTKLFNQLQEAIINKLENTTVAQLV